MAGVLAREGANARHERGEPIPAMTERLLVVLEELGEAGEAEADGSEDGGQRPPALRAIGDLQGGAHKAEAT
jgi:hypothetical protein